MFKWWSIIVCGILMSSMPNPAASQEFPPLLDSNNALCDLPTHPRQSLLESHDTLLAPFTARRAFAVTALNAGLADEGTLTQYQTLLQTGSLEEVHTFLDSSDVGINAFNQIWSSFEDQAGAEFPDHVHCDNDLTNGLPSLNGHLVQCPRNEAGHLDQIDMFRITAVVNRIDLAPADGSHCGEQRIIFASTISGERNFLIMMAQIPNPRPEAGRFACKPLAHFWATLTDKSEEDRKRELFQAYYTGHPTLRHHGFRPFLDQAHFTKDTGHIWTNSFVSPPWTMREFALTQNSEHRLHTIRRPVDNNSQGALWNDAAALPLPHQTLCQEAIVQNLESLLGTNINTMGLELPNICYASESRNNDQNNYATQLIPHGPFWTQIQDKLTDLESSLTPEEIGRRAHLTTACIGCHVEANPSLGPGSTFIVSAPPAFVHVQERSMDSCGIPEGPLDCHRISTLLTTEFLPHRQQVLEEFLCLLASPDSRHSTVSVGPSTVQANGEDTATLLIIPRDSDGKALKDRSISLSADSPSVTITQADDPDQIRFLVTNTLKESVTLTATDITDPSNPIPFEETATVLFLNPTAEPPNSVSNPQQPSEAANLVVTLSGSDIDANIGTCPNCRGIIDWSIGIINQEGAEAHNVTMTQVIPSATLFSWRPSEAEPPLKTGSDEMISCTPFNCDPSDPLVCLDVIAPDILQENSLVIRCDVGTLAVNQQFTLGSRAEFSPGTYSTTVTATTITPESQDQDNIQTLEATVRAVPPPPMDGGGNGGCFIATAAFGSYLAPEVYVLREFRDLYLLPSTVGQLLVDTYYATSPPIANVISRYPPLKAFIRGALWPIILWAQLTLKAPILGFTILGGCLILTLYLLIWIIRNKLSSLS